MWAKHDIFFKIAVPAWYSIKMGPDGKKYVAYEPTDGGTVDHAALESNLAWADSWHTGTASSIATFDAQWDTSVISFTEWTTDFLREDGTFAEPPGTAVAGTDNIGYLNIPILEKSTNYTTILTDSGKCITHPASDTNDRNFIIAYSWDVDYPNGTAIMMKNNSVNDVLIATLSDTITQDGTGDYGYFTLAQHWRATLIKEATTNWSIGWVGITKVTAVSFTKDSEYLADLDTKLASGTGTITFSDPVLFVPTIWFFDVLDNSPAGWTISVTWGLWTATITVSWNAPDVDDVYIKGISVSNTGYYLVNWTSNNYTLF